MIESATRGRLNVTAMRMLAGLLVLGALGAPAMGQEAMQSARCAANVAVAVAHSAGIKLPVSGQDRISAAACKRWPHLEDSLLAAFAFDQGIEGQKTFVAAIVDGQSGKVQGSYQTRVEEDALLEFGAGSLAIDTAPYRLAAGVRAFGVRFNSAARGASCPDTAWADELTLFVPAADGLRPVLHGLAMSRFQATSGCLGNGLAAPVHDEVKLFLDVAKTRSHGFQDLLVKARITRVEKDGRKRPAKTESYLLRYNGSTYEGANPAPWWFGSSPLGE